MTRYSSSLHAALFQAVMRYVNDEKIAHVLSHECSDILHVYIREPAIRDQFAMACVSSGKITGAASEVARLAYAYADAMIKAREVEL
jgi:hypothetical protein